MNDDAKYPPVLDACCGSRAFWFDKEDGRAMFVDKRAGVFPLSRKTPRSPVVVSPDWQGSFTDMPFPGGTFDHVVFDPPHHTAKRLGTCDTGNVVHYYGRLDGDWREMLRQGFAECFRVLRPGGTLIFKWLEAEIPVREILALTPERPLYGHKSGKASKTHWIAFLKPNKERAKRSSLVHSLVRCREQLASYAHDAWGGWMAHLFRICKSHADGSVVILPELVARWRRQLRTPYDELPEDERLSDLKEADKMLEIIGT